MTFFVTFKTHYRFALIIYFITFRIKCSITRTGIICMLVILSYQEFCLQIAGQSYVCTRRSHYRIIFIRNPLSMMTATNSFKTASMSANFCEIDINFIYVHNSIFLKFCSFIPASTHSKINLLDNPLSSNAFCKFMHASLAFSADRT